MKTAYIIFSTRKIAKSVKITSLDGNTIIVVDADETGAVVGIEIVGEFVIENCNPRRRKVKR